MGGPAAVRFSVPILSGYRWVAVLWSVQNGSGLYMSHVRHHALAAFVASGNEVCVVCRQCLCVLGLGQQDASLPKLGGGDSSPRLKHS